MSLYVRFTGERIRLTAAELRTVWVVFSKENIDWYYEKPKKLQRGQRVEVNRVWHVQAVYAESSKARPCREGEQRRLDDVARRTLRLGAGLFRR